VRAIPLPQLALTALAERAAEFVQALDTACGGATTPAEHDNAEQAIDATIAWLRSTVTQPVMAAFDAPVPRIWWSPTSVLSFLPLHATVADQMVSSYTPTVGALLRARARAQPEPLGQGLVVALPNTPGHARLPGVTRECDLLTELFPDTVVLRGPAATRAGVLRQLPAHEWVHLACHGRNDIVQPSSSNVRLWDAPLSVQDLTELDTDRGVLAVLTACETAQGSTRLADEALHVGGAFHLAGYAHVVATLWSAHDTASAELTEAFYRRLSGSAETGLDAIGSAAALHAAVRELRDRYPNQPSRWAPYLHVGP
jgi:CHAT domain-containing protein